MPHPIVNEPGYESRDGSVQSKEYNASLRLETMRHAMVATLRSPPVGFEEAVHRHFQLQRQRVLLTCLRWTLEVRRGRERQGRAEEGSRGSGGGGDGSAEHS